MEVEETRYKMYAEYINRKSQEEIKNAIEILENIGNNNYGIEVELFLNKAVSQLRLALSICSKLGEYDAKRDRKYD